MRFWNSWQWAGHRINARSSQLIFRLFIRVIQNEIRHDLSNACQKKKKEISPSVLIFRNYRKYIIYVKYEKWKKMYQHQLSDLLVFMAFAMSMYLTIWQMFTLGVAMVIIDVGIRYSSSDSSRILQDLVCLCLCIVKVCNLTKPFAWLYWTLF